ncbi:hypothetical protein F4677DRAFT_427526 [Hypoxylon crocopeplum]|nr:hypothetical protein F4677DRAFT_427526 [Hypoxylon crocopeplum]
MSSTLETPFSPTTNELISEHSFIITIWVATSVCILTGCLRFTIRLTCFRYLFAEDYLMLAALAILISFAAVLQRSISDIYLIQHVENQLAIPGPDFQDRLASGLRGDGTVLILGTIGIWAVKLNFLLFFRRFGRQIRTYMVFWWIAFVIIVASGAVHIGVIPYDCQFGSLNHIVYDCSLTSNVSNIYMRYKASISVDVLSDATIICFPVVIVWKTKINLRQKLVLTAVFFLVGLTIAVTIIRGSIFGGVYKDAGDADAKVIDTSWVIFWLFIEYIVSFIIACIISFRSLWINIIEKSKGREIELSKQRRVIMARQDDKQRGKGLKAKWQRFQDSVVNTLGDLEGTTFEDNSMRIRFQPPSPRLTIDFSQWGNSTSPDVNAGSDTHQNLDAGIDLPERPRTIETDLAELLESGQARHMGVAA